MGFIKRIFQLSLSKREIVRSKRFMAILMIPIFVIQMSSLNLFLMQAVIAEDGESDVVAESEEIKEAPPEEESAPDEIEKSDPPKEEVKPINVEEVSKESPADEDALVALEEIIPNSISEVIDEVKEEILPVVAPEIIQEEAVENDEGGRITPEAAYDENLEVSAPAPVVQEPRIEEGWKENADGSSSITVKAGNEYEFKDSGLKIKFTRIDNGTGEITVKEIELTPEQVTISGALSNKAWDITSDMVDGTFEYVLTLPVEENTKLENAEIIYVENKEDLSDKDKIKTVKEEDVKVDEEKDEVVAEKLDHFTIYIVSKTVKLFGQVNGSSQVTVTPGEMITVTMEVQLSGNEPNDWLSSRYQIEGGIQTCVNTPDHIDSGTYTESFDITAPTNLGTYDLTLRAYDQSGCPSGGKRDEEIMQNAIIVVATTPFANPALPESCGLDIALVLDNSTSIDSGELSTMKSAMISFVNALAGTPTQFSVTRFATTASVVQNFTSDTAAVISAINSIPVGGGYTNWEDGLLEAQSTLSNRSEIFDLVIFASDGNPNRVDNGTSVDESQAVSEAVLVANDIKSNGARILALGIGNGLDTANLIALSGPVVNASDIADSDVVTSNFPDLANDLGAFASATCGGTISVNKYYDQVDEVHRGGSGWIFDVAGTSKTTDSNGQTESVKVDAGTYSVTETSLLSGYTYDSASCYKVASPSHIEIGEDITNGVGNIPVGNSDIVYCNFVNTTNKGSITITKDAVPNDAQDFSFTTTGTGLSSFSLDDDSDATLSNTKVFNNLMPGTFSISENSVNDWNLDDISCTGASDFSKDINSRSVTINLKPGENITCTFTNKIQTGTLIVKKVVTNDNGGMKIASDFTFSVDGGSAVAFEADGQNELTVSAGTYSITEPAVSGYATTYENCTNIAVPNGGSATCTIKNDDIAPTLSVVKKVINDNGGNETVDAFEIKMNDNLLSFGAGVPSGDTTTYTANPTVTANASYALSEKDLAGYTEGTWNCKTVAGAPVAYPVTLAEGQNVICEISNDDIAPTITLIKEVINNNGGQAGVNDFGLSIGGAIVSSGQVYSVEANTAYALNEIGLSGYEFVSITGDAKCPIALGGTATLNEGENITCTIKNDDQSPKLHLRKIVTSNNGGTATAADFTLTADGSGLNDISGTSPVDSDGTLQADTFILSETGPAGYLGGEWVCSGDGRQSGASITLGLGEEATCTITNDDQAAHLKLIKKVINDNDGKAVAEDFTLSASGPTPLTGDGVVESDVNAGKYTLSETTNLTGYEAGDWSCTNGVIVNENKEITLALGQSTVCSITNDDIQPKLTVTKVVNNSNYGNLAVADFPLYVGATSVISGVQNKFNVGSYIISETGKPGYSAEISGDCDPNGNVTLTPGDVKSCTITNTDNLGKIIIEKQTLPDGDTQMFTFNGDISGSIADGGILEKIVIPGNYSVSEIVPSGWDLTSLICDDENSGASVVAGATANINMEANETVKCTFTNTKRGLITVAKDAINNDAQDFEFTNNFSNDNPAIFYLDDDSNGALPKLRTFEVLPGEYWVSEEAVAGWQQESATCDNGDTIDSINVEPGENITCEFVNEKYAKIILVKNTIGGDDTFDFDAMGDGLPVDIDLTTANGTASQAFENLDQDNTYSIAENVPTNWNLTSAICTGDGNTPDKITPEPGETVTCTFTNTKKSNLTVVKKVINDNGGIKTVDDFGINFSGGALNFDAGVSLGSTTTYTSQTLTVNPGSHNLFENDVFGYTEGVWDCGAVGAGGISTVVSLAPGENKTCTIINDDVAPTITLNKNVTGGIAGVNEFGLTIGDVAVNSGVKTNVSANIPIALNEAGLDGYTFTSLAGGEGCPEALGGTVTLREGEEISCTITNTRDAGSITVNKIIDMDGNLQTTEDQVSGVGWQFDVDGIEGDTSDPVADFTGAEGNVSFADLKTGEYTIIENKQSGYDLVAADCGLENGIFDGIDSMDNVSVDKDGNTICNFYNVPNGTIHGYKWSDLNGNGERDCIEESGEDLEPVVFDDSEMYQCELEPLLSGWTINLYQSNGEGGFGSEPIRTMVTDSGSEHFGWYWFENLPLGEYKVCEVLQDDWRQTHPLNSDDNCHFISLPSGNSNGFGLPAMLNAVDGPVYSFGNQQLAKVTIIKFEDLDGNGQKDEGEDYLPGWEINLSGQDSVNTDENGEVVFDELLPESYVLSETLQPGWNQTNIYCEDNNGSGVKITSEGEAYGHHGNCEGWNQCGDAENCAQWACRVRGYSSLVSYGESRPCTQFNNCHLFQHSVISAPPILSIDSSYQDNEYIDYDWGNSCNVMGVTDIICSNSGFSEAMILSEDDSESDLVSENNYRLALSAGDSKTCYVGNQFVEPELTILKYNNQWPTVQSPGSVIDYTIKVEAQKNNVKGVVVTDLPPEGFKYISGSWSATSSLGGGHDGKLELSHEYASPGEWDLGDMQAGEVITLSYRAQIDGAQQPGLYNDLAWADGTDNRSARVLATSMPAPAVDPGEITDNFVGTQIELAVAPLPQNVELEEDEKTETKTKKKVLGVTTYLPATGTPTMWIILAVLILIAGISLMIFARRRNDKIKNMKDKTLMLAVIVTGMMFLGADAQAMAPAIRLAQPTTPTEIKNQNIAFSVLDIDNRLVTVDCYKKGPADSDWVKFSTVGLPSGGSSGVCAINLDIDGGYDFYTEATAGGEVSKSKTVSLVLNTAVPGTPRKYNRNGGSCSVSFTTADDGGLTGKVVMYRSKNTEFVADNSTKVQEGNFGSNIEGVLTDPNDNCDDYYYAIQAVSEGGIGSDFTGDEDVDVETRTRTRTVYEENIVYTGGGAIPVEETEGTITEEAGATATEGGVTEEGAVQGEATEGALSEGAETEQGKVAGMFSEKNSKYGWVLVGLAVLGATYYVMRRRAKKKSELPLDEN